jgi:hypothetical protein
VTEHGLTERISKGDNGMTDHMYLSDDFTDSEMWAVQRVLNNGLAELIRHDTTDEEIDAYVVAAEAGAAGPIFGLREELVSLRDLRADLRDAIAEHAHRFAHRSPEAVDL